jgi:hypothetical protein
MKQTPTTDVFRVHEFFDTHTPDIYVGKARINGMVFNINRCSCGAFYDKSKHRDGTTSLQHLGDFIKFSSYRKPFYLFFKSYRPELLNEWKIFVDNCADDRYV